MDLDAYWKKICNLVDTHGWAVQSVFEDVEKGIPSISYTVGLSARGLPEILLMGIDPRTANILLNAAAEKLIGGEFQAQTGAIVNEVANMPLRVKQLTISQFEHFGRMAMLHGENFSHAVPSFQLVFPDSMGRFPDDPSCDPMMREIQDIDSMIARDSEPAPAKPYRGPRKH